jgi:hypothetical protein
MLFQYPHLYFFTPDSQNNRLSNLIILFRGCTGLPQCERRAWVRVAYKDILMDISVTAGCS